MAVPEVVSSTAKKAV